MPTLDSPRRITDHAPRLGLPSGPLMWLMGFAFTAAGVFTMVMALGPWVPDKDINAPRWVLAVIGFIFFAPGMAMLISQLRGNRGRGNVAVWDRYRRWSRQRLRDESPRDIRIHALWLLALAVFMTPFNYFVWEKVSRGRWLSPEVFGVGLFDLVLLVMLVHLAYKLLRWVRHGRSFLQLNGFPIPLGREVELRVIGPKSLQPGTTLQARLRAIESRWEERRSAGRSRSTATAYCLFEEEQVVVMQQAGECLLRWRLPEEPVTSLGEEPVRYWELQLRAERPGIDYKADFLLPVYRV